MRYEINRRCFPLRNFFLFEKYLRFAKRDTIYNNAGVVKAEF